MSDPDKNLASNRNITQQDALMENFANPSMAMLLAATGHPLLAISWAMAFGTLGYVKSISRDRLEEFSQMLAEGKFTDDDLQTEGFREGLLISFDYFMKERFEQKRKVIGRIFLGFISSNDRKKFKFERMCQILQSLELDDITALKRIWEIVIPKVLEGHRKDYDDKVAAGYKAKTFEQFVDSQKNSGWGFDQDQSNKIQDGLIEGLSNLQRWGIITVTTPQGTFGGPGRSHYKLTPFGYEFGKFAQDKNANTKIHK